MWNKTDISSELNRFVKSDSFNDFKAICDDMARQKFIELQTAPDALTHADLIAGRKILNIYLNLPREFEFRLKQLEQEKEAESTKRVEDSQRVSD